VGRLYAISSFGSILGTFLAGFLLIALIGSTNILLFLALILAVTSLLVSLDRWRAKAAAILALLLTLPAVAAYDHSMSEIGFYDLDTPYSRVFVYPSVNAADGTPTRVLTTHPKAIQSAMAVADPIELVVDYTRFYSLAWHFKPELQHLLMLGGGGYSFPKYVGANHPQVALEVVELDPGITALARRFFALSDHPRLTIHHEDGRMFLARNNKQYDAMLVDTFSSHYAMPFHLSTLESVSKIYHSLVEDGVVLVNVLATLKGPQSRFLRAETATYRKIFPQVLLFPVADPGNADRWQNVLLVGLKSSRPASLASRDPRLADLLTHFLNSPIDEDLPVLTDDFAPVDYYLSHSYH
jgi:spermidine synthase